MSGRKLVVVEGRHGRLPTSLRTAVTSGQEGEARDGGERATKGASVASAKCHLQKQNKTSEATVAKCQHVLNWSDRCKGDRSIPCASCYVRKISR